SLNQDVWGLLVIAAVAFALWRRLTHNVARLSGAETHPNDPLLILSWIGALMVTMFADQSFGMVAEGVHWSVRPLSAALAGFLNGPVTPHQALRLGQAAWLAHGLLVLGFLNYLPYSRHLHVVVSLPNVYLSNTSGPGVRGAMSPMDLE